MTHDRVGEGGGPPQGRGRRTLVMAGCELKGRKGGCKRPSDGRCCTGAPTRQSTGVEKVWHIESVGDSAK